MYIGSLGTFLHDLEQLVLVVFVLVGGDLLDIRPDLVGPPHGGAPDAKASSKPGRSNDSLNSKFLSASLLVLYIYI